MWSRQIVVFFFQSQLSASENEIHPGSLGEATRLKLGVLDLKQCTNGMIFICLFGCCCCCFLDSADWEGGPGRDHRHDELKSPLSLPSYQFWFLTFQVQHHTVYSKTSMANGCTFSVT